MERRSSSSLWALAASVAVVLGASCTRRDGAALVPKTVDPDSKEVVGYLAIPSLAKALRDVSAVAERFAPGKATPESLRAELGAMLNDPQLAGLDQDKPILLCALKAGQPGQPPSLAAMLPVKQGAPYEKTLAQMGMATRSSGGLLLVSQSPDGLETAAKARGAYDQIARAGLTKSARLHARVGGLVDAYGPLIESHLDGLLGMFSSAAVASAARAPLMDPQVMVKLLKLELQGLLALLRQCETTQIDIDLGGRNIGLDQVVTAREGSALAEGFTSSSKRPSPSASVIQSGFVMGVLRFDPRGFGSLTRQVLKEASRGLEDIIPPEAVEIWATMGDWWGGTAAFSMRPGEKDGFLLEYVIDVLDEARSLEMQEKGMALFAPGTVLGDLYRGMGIESTG